MRELQEFLAAQPHHITEFDETLVRHLLAKVTVSFDRLDFTFQSGVAVSIESESLQNPPLQNIKAGEDF